MKYQTYPAYKDSGVEWLDNVPEHWNIKRTKAMFALTRTLVGKQSKDYQLLSLTLKGIVHRDISDGGGKIPAEFDTYQEVKKQDLVFCLFDIDETPRTIGLSSYDGMITGAYNVYRCLNICAHEYAYYYFMHIDSFKGLKPFYTGLRKVVRAETFSNIKIPAPALEEQQKIAQFLDHETAKIDTLIEKQQRLIELLKEKRQAVISHAVTKGLNPNAPMKESGVAWLGDVPEGWSFAPLRRYLLEHKQGYYTTDDYVDDGVKLLRITDIRDLGNIDTSDCPKVPSNDSALTNYELIDGDVVFARTGGAGSFGVIKNLKERVVFASYLIRFRFQRAFYEDDYLKYMLFADSFQKAVKQNIHGGVNQNLHAEDIKNTYLTQPPIDEQKEIVIYLDDKTFKINSLILKAQNAIELMQERRTALISAAVTGKIDVRDWGD